MLQYHCDNHKLWGTLSNTCDWDVREYDDWLNNPRTGEQVRQAIDNKLEEALK
jgi:hypothetical protein